jgi:hypothetical protein
LFEFTSVQDFIEYKKQIKKMYFIFIYETVSANRWQAGFYFSKIFATFNPNQNPEIIHNLEAKKF